MVLCFAIGCNHQTVRNQCSFFRFPKDAKNYTFWTQMARRSDKKPDSDARLCSCHFVEGKKINGPTIFSYNEGKRFESENIRENHQRKRKRSAVKESQILKERKENEEERNKDIEIIILKNENELLKQEIETLKLELKNKTTKFLFSQISEKDKLVLMYTGLPSKNIFFSLLSYISRLEFTYKDGWKVDSLTMEDQLFITLQKLRQNYSFMDLAVRYAVSETTVRNVFFTLLHVLHESVFLAIMEENIPSLNKVQNFSYNSDFPNCRFLIDTTEIFIETPRSDLEAQRQTYSHYKKRQTFKALVAVSPKGMLCFVSRLFPGSTSDKNIFKDCGIIKCLRPGDLILADKGFLIHDLLPQGVSLNIPPFLINPQFTKSEAKFTTKLSRSRVHVERAIQRIKSFEILQNIPHHFQQSAPIMFQVCAALVNLQTPLIKE